ncbi:hypothetical protein BDQ17DRAFT_1432529 [Cyathus striatus]|nr:hypothetical protein BDQ17DRAFT_1432529 [Cyathus striatus]
MSTPQDLFNQLPSLQDASNLFPTDLRNRVLLDLYSQGVFRNHPQYAVALVHRHTTLHPGEFMVNTGDVASPKIRTPESIHATSWLTLKDQPYEYASDVTPDETPVHDLLTALSGTISRLKVPQFSGIDILGIRYLPEIPSPGYVFSETRKCDRSSITSLQPKPDNLDDPGMVQSCWLVGEDLVDELVRVGCICINEDGNYHIQINCGKPVIGSLN